MITYIYCFLSQQASKIVGAQRVARMPHYPVFHVLVKFEIPIGISELQSNTPALSQFRVQKFLR